jgi:Second Messenger Oligonucleotide or Dinucleotide Synthetase domain
VARTVAEAFDIFLGRLTPTKAQRESGASHRATVKAALEAKLTVRNFFETGSFSHGTGVRGYSDIDALVSLGEMKPESSYTALNWVKDILSNRFPLTTVKIRRPAVVVEFGGGYETWEVIPGFLTTRGGPDQLVYDIPGPSAGAAYIDSAPKEHLAYVNECNKEPDKGDAKELARLIKAWKYFRNVPISSFYLEMRCAQHVATQKTYIHIYDVCQVLEKLEGHELAPMNDPSGASGRIHACSSDATREDALSKLSTAAARARKALDAYKDEKYVTAFDNLDLLFGGKFPARDV